MKLLLLASAIAAWFAFFLLRSRDGGLETRGLIVAVGASVALGLFSYYVGAVLLTLWYGA